jgi:hypothetical protein
VSYRLHLVVGCSYFLCMMWFQYALSTVANVLSQLSYMPGREDEICTFAQHIGTVAQHIGTVTTMHVLTVTGRHYVTGGLELAVLVALSALSGVHCNTH